MGSTKLQALLLASSALSESTTPGPEEPLPPTRALSVQGCLPESSQATFCLGSGKEVASLTPCNLQNEQELWSILIQFLPRRFSCINHRVKFMPKWGEGGRGKRNRRPHSSKQGNHSQQWLFPLRSRDYREGAGVPTGAGEKPTQRDGVETLEGKNGQKNQKTQRVPECLEPGLSSPQLPRKAAPPGKAWTYLLITFLECLPLGAEGQDCLSF